MTVTKIILDKSLESDLIEFERLFKTLPDIIINICMRVGMSELKNAFELLPAKYKLEMIKQLKDVLPQTTDISKE